MRALAEEKKKGAKNEAAAQKEAGVKGKGRTGERSSIVEQISKPDSEGLRVTVDFAGWPDLFKRLEEVARENFRTVEGHILFLVSGGIEVESKIGGNHRA